MLHTLITAVTTLPGCSWSPQAAELYMIVTGHYRAGMACAVGYEDSSIVSACIALHRVLFGG